MAPIGQRQAKDAAKHADARPTPKSHLAPNPNNAKLRVPALKEGELQNFVLGPHLLHSSPMTPSTPVF